MKRNWQIWLALTLTTVMVGSANAQSTWDEPAEVGSYQSILARAGYRQESQAPDFAPDSQPQSAPQMRDAGGRQHEAIGQTAQPSTGACDGDCGGGDCGGGDCGGGGYAGGWTSGGPAGGLSNRLESVSSGPNSNYVIGARALFMRRDYEDDLRLTRNPAGDILYTTDADLGTLYGVDTTLTKRNCQGNGFQIGYWGLYSRQEEGLLTGPGLDTYLTTLGDLTIDGYPGGDAQMYYNSAEGNTIYRNNTIHNVEINMLRNVGNYTTRHGQAGNFELLGGFRWFQFNENFGYSAYNSMVNPDRVDYEIFNKNTLLGFQVGGRNELCISNRLSLVGKSKLGVFNNHISSDQRICDSNNLYAKNSMGRDYNYMNMKDDLSLLGELDLGMAYRFSSRVRATWGYRVVGVSGIALAPDQIPRDFDNSNEIDRINSNGDLILGGGYAGLEYCY